MRILVRTPDHLGDGVMALPAVRAVARLGPTRVIGPPWASPLYDGCDTAEGDADPDLAVLFKPSFRAAWEHRSVPRRVGLDWDGRWPLLTTAVQPGGHRVEEYNRIARAAGAHPEGLPSWRGVDCNISLPSDFVLLLPGTASGAVVRWAGFRALADALGERAVFSGGPGDELDAGPHAVVPPLELDAFAGLATRAAAIVGNDSGLCHLAAAARRARGVDPGRVFVVHGSTRPGRTGPPGSTALLGPALPCSPCYRKRCSLGLGCLGVPVAEVLACLVTT